MTIPAAPGPTYARSRRDVTLQRLLRLLGYPTVSSDPGHAADMDACAAALARLLARIGLRRRGADRRDPAKI